jgi:hypothetical protein
MKKKEKKKLQRTYEERPWSTRLMIYTACRVIVWDQMIIASRYLVIPFFPIPNIHYCVRLNWFRWVNFIHSLRISNDTHGKVVCSTIQLRKESSHVDGRTNATFHCLLTKPAFQATYKHYSNWSRMWVTTPRTSNFSASTRLLRDDIFG